jgi:HTH-type transcriptional regulator / antitoxin HigA
MTDAWGPDWAVRPGSILLEVLAEQEMSAPTLADQLGRPLVEVLDLFAAATPITPEIAGDLEQVLGISARFWLNLEQKYREQLARGAKESP